MRFSLSRSSLLSRLIPIVLFLMGISLGRVSAQNQTILRLDTASTALQTGQYYDVAIRIENAPQFWAMDLTLAYDPATLYIAGTKAGSPITAGEMFSSSTSIVVKNQVENGALRYTVSKIGETAPAEGSGVIGTLRLYPLKAGASRMQFPQLQAVALSSYDPNATDVTTSEITVVPALLDLTISGADVEIPQEATATPQPTETPTETVNLAGQAQPTERPTLENIVFSTATPAALTPQAVPTAPTDNSALIAIGIGLVIVAVLGFGALMVLQRRR